MGTCHTKEPSIVNPPNLLPDSPESFRKKRASSRLFRFKTTSIKHKDGFKNNELIHKVYRIMDPIGKGSFGEVRKAIHLKTGQARAIKIIKFDTTGSVDRKEIVSEIMLLKDLDHPNIVKIIEYFESSNSLFIVMELIEGKPLIEYIVSNMKSLSQATIAAVLTQIMSALAYLHSRSIVHRDIKSENVLFNGKVATLVDFGLSRHLKKKRGFEEVEGTTLYMAPEVIKSSGTEKSDIWACGVIFYILVSGSFPFQGSNRNEIQKKIESNELTVPLGQIKGISSTTLDLLSQMLRPNPKQRISAAQALNHAFLVSNKAELDTSSLDETFNNMLHYVYKSHLEQAIHIFFSDIFISQNEEASLIAIFREIDTDNSGCISKEEFRVALTKTGNLANDQEIDQMFNRIDLDGSGQISFQEYKMATIDRNRLMSEQNIEVIFRLFDNVG
jgi:calcium-dependent protein kinase